MNKYNFMNNISLKIMAIVFASVLWLVVVNIDDPVETATFRNVEVTVQNTEVVTNKGKTYNILDDSQNISVLVTAKRSVISKISSGNIVATADMTEMQMESLIPIAVTIPGYEGKYTAESTPRNLKVKTEDKTKRVFPLTVNPSGTLRDGYVIGEMLTNPEKIEVRGAESLLNSIEKAVAKVDVSGLSKTTVLSAELVYYDRNGNPVDKTQLTSNLGTDGLTVNVQVLNTKNVTLKFNVSGTPAEGYVFGKVISEPEKIQVCGTADSLSDFNEVEIPGTEIDISKASSKIEKTIDVLPFLPEGIKLVDETGNNVVVTVSIEQEGTKTVELPVEAIQVFNLQKDLKVSFDDNTDISVQFQGAAETLEKINAKNSASVDLKSYTKPGVYEVPVKIEIDSEINVRVTKNPTVKVTLTEKDEKETQE